jgi:hypothetical protein
MPTHRPFRPQPARPRRGAAPLLVLSATAVLANFGWTSTYKPDPFAYQRLRHRDRDDTPGGQEPRSQHGAGETAGSATRPIGADRPAHRPPAATGAVTDGPAVGGVSSPDHGPDGEVSGNGFGEPGSAADVVDEQTATAHWFVTAALDGRLGDAHQQAAQTAVTVAPEHGFVDDPTRVAEALVVFLHPDHR